MIDQGFFFFESEKGLGRDKTQAEGGHCRAQARAEGFLRFEDRRFSGKGGLARGLR